jgi:hypothetical protein
MRFDWKFLPGTFLQNCFNDPLMRFDLKFLPGTFLQNWRQEFSPRVKDSRMSLLLTHYSHHFRDITRMCDVTRMHYINAFSSQETAFFDLKKPIIYNVSRIMWSRLMLSFGLYDQIDQVQIYSYPTSCMYQCICLLLYCGYCYRFSLVPKWSH